MQFDVNCLPFGSPIKPLQGKATEAISHIILLIATRSLCSGRLRLIELVLSIVLHSAFFAMVAFTAPHH